jgi:hypothetical protein
MSRYFIAPDESGYSIIACYDDATEEVHISGIRTQKLAERALALAGQPIRYDERRLKLY